MKSDTARWTRFQFAMFVLVAAAAIAVRLYYVHTAVVDHPLRGDTIQYFAYALNLVDHHVFSLAPPGGSPLPDGFRDPGYPAFLALLVAMFGRGQVFYIATLEVQAVLSGLTVAIYALLARQWLGPRTAIAVGIGLVFWPHTITLAGYLLSETLMGFLFATGLWLTNFAAQRNHWTLFAAAGACLGMAALTNATFAPIPFIFGVIAFWKNAPARRLWVVFLMASLLPMAAWTYRAMTLPAGQSAGDRVVMNLVQGSWPEYHDAWRDALLGDPSSKAVMEKMDAEYAAFHRGRLEGLSVLAARLMSQPLRYTTWYLRKPAELWGWQIGIGMGDIYVFPTYYSPLSSTGALRITTDALFFVSPIILMLAAAGVVVLAVDRKHMPAALGLAAVTATVITLTFTTLQCDARYSTPYRGIEWLLAAVAVHAIGRTLQRRKLHKRSIDKT
ncbi:ArnT family glycosyltransferase [Luteibacter sp. 9135]|uniref:ArnT family glycosyltransferase n=1 Tax=Luteibacter sp. 9135 TaxID=1500893 RepID=UPI000560CC31|nr:glycosyltransferase family 39 protein [Luteibacter sp. 9135]